MQSEDEKTERESNHPSLNHSSHYASLEDDLTQEIEPYRPAELEPDTSKPIAEAQPSHDKATRRLHPEGNPLSGLDDSGLPNVASAASDSEVPTNAQSSDASFAHIERQRAFNNNQPFPVIRKPVPVSQSGPLKAPQPGDPVEPAPDYTAAQASVPKPPPPPRVDTDFSDIDDLGLDDLSSDAWVDPRHTDYAAQQPFFETDTKRPGLSRPLILTAAVLLPVAAGVGVGYLTQPPMKLWVDQQLSSLGWVPVGPDSESVSDSQAEAVQNPEPLTTVQSFDLPSVDVDDTVLTEVQPSPVVESIPVVTIPSMAERFRTQLLELEALIADGQYAQAQQALDTMDLALYGYGAPEFSALEEQIRRAQDNTTQASDTLNSEAERFTSEQEALAEEARLAEQARIAAQERRIEEARLAEQARLEAERVAEQELLLEEARLEQARLEAEQVAEQVRLAEEARLEQIRLEEAERAAEQSRLAEQLRLEQAQAAEQMRIEEQERLAEAARLQAERVSEQTRIEEQARLDEENRLEQARLEAEQAAEQARLAEQTRAEPERFTEDADMRQLSDAGNNTGADDPDSIEALAALQRLQARQRRLEQARSQQAAASEPAPAVSQEVRSLSQALSESVAEQDDQSPQRSSLMSDETAQSQLNSTAAPISDNESPGSSADMLSVASAEVQAITDDDLALAYQRFLRLQNAIEWGDSETVATLVDSGSTAFFQKVQMMIRNHQNIETTLGRIAASEPLRRISGELEIVQLERLDNGALTRPPEELELIQLIVTRENGEWSKIQWQ